MTAHAMTDWCRYAAPLLGNPALLRGPLRGFACRSAPSAVPDRRKGRQSGGRLARPSDDQLTSSRIRGQTQVCDLVVHAVRQGVRHGADWDGS